MKRTRVLAVLVMASAWLSIDSGFAATNRVQNLPGWGTITDPDGDCTFKSGEGKITVTVPGAIHDLSIAYPKKNAPRILREVNGDFTAEVKASGELEPGDEAVEAGRVAFNSGGLLLWDGAKNFIRLERDAWVLPTGEKVSYAPLFEYWRNDELVPLKTTREESFPKDDFTYMRLSRRGNEIQVYGSVDGKKWFKGGSVTGKLPKKIQLGIVAINTSKKPLTLEFSEFKLTK